MSENVDLSLVLRNTQHASRDARAALEATLRFTEAFAPRLTALEARVGALEQRIGGIERALDDLARSNSRLEELLIDIARKLDA